MKRFVKTGLMLAMIVVMMIDAAVMVSAAGTPKDLSETEQAGSSRDVTLAHRNSITIPVMGYIVPLSNPVDPKQPDNKPKQPVSYSVPVNGKLVKAIKTGDESDFEFYILLTALTALLMLLGIVHNQEEQEETNSLENAYS